MKLKCRRGIVENLSFVSDEHIKDKANGVLVAVVLYGEGGNIIYWHKSGYDPMEVMVAGEKFMGDAIKGGRYKEYVARVKK